MIRKVIKITAEDSPNVKAGRVIFPGVLTKEEYETRRKTWDVVRQSIGLDAEFYEGAELLMYPPTWLNEAERRWVHLKSSGVVRYARAMGVDPAEGGDSTSISVVDGKGLIELKSLKTPNTAVIKGVVADTIRRYGVNPTRVVFDTGGGGKQIADQMREDGFPVRAVSFGSSPRIDIKRGLVSIEARKDVIEDKGAYVLLRDQMYYEFRELLDPQGGDAAFALPPSELELRRQLALIPLTYDKQGRIKLIPKHSSNSDEDTLVKRLGRSPDEADSLVLAVHGLLHKSHEVKAGAV